MGGFLNGKRMVGVVGAAGAALKVAAVSMLFVCCASVLSGCGGCKRRPVSAGEPELEVVITNRMADPVYRKALYDNRQAQAQIAVARQAVVDRMRRFVDEARAALPEGSDDEAVKAELAKNPEWKALEEENAQKIGDLNDLFAKAREVVRRRIEAEQRDVQMVAQGRAVAAPVERHRMPRPDTASGTGGQPPQTVKE